MKMMLAFVGGIVIGGLVLGGLLSPALSLAGGSGDLGLTEILPDIKRIYYEAVVTPFQEAEQELEDEEIAEFYHLMLQKCGLDKPYSGSN